MSNKYIVVTIVVDDETGPTHYEIDADPSQKINFDMSIAVDWQLDSGVYVGELCKANAALLATHSIIILVDGSDSTVLALVADDVISKFAK